MSLDVIGDAMHALWEDAQRDEELRSWFRDVDALIRDATSSSLLAQMCESAAVSSSALSC